MGNPCRATAGSGCPGKGIPLAKHSVAPVSNHNNLEDRGIEAQGCSAEHGYRAGGLKASIWAAAKLHPDAGSEHLWAFLSSQRCNIS